MSFIRKNKTSFTCNTATSKSFLLSGSYLTRSAFTLMEILTVIILIGIIASFAVPNYTRTVERAHLRDATTNLIAIHAANQVYRAENNVFWPDPPGNGDLTAINTNLRLSIIANGMTYSCRNNTTNDFTCTAIRQAPAAAFTVTVTETTPPNPVCTGVCP